MICPNCGNEVTEKDSKCPHCGHKLSPILDPKRVTFKDAIKNLFSKLFLFEGKDTRKMFNLGLLFLFLVVTGLNMIFMLFFIQDYIAIFSNANNANELTELFKELTSSQEFVNYSRLFNGITATLSLTFLIAPVFRRTMDNSNNKKMSLIFTIIFGLGYFINLLNVFVTFSSVLAFVLNLFSIAADVVLVVCIFKPSHEVRYYEDADNS